MHTIARIKSILIAAKDFSPSSWANENRSILDEQNWQNLSDETLKNLLLTIAYSEKYDLGWLDKWQKSGELEKLITYMEPKTRALRVQEKAQKNSQLFKILAYFTLLLWPSIGFIIDINTGFDMAMIPSAIGLIIGLIFFFNLYIGPLGKYQTALAEILIPPLIKQNEKWLLTWRSLDKEARKPYRPLAKGYKLGIKHVMRSSKSDCKIEFLWANGRNNRYIAGNYMFFIKSFYIIHITGPKAASLKALALQTLHNKKIIKIIENENELMLAYTGNWFFNGWRPKWNLENNREEMHIKNIFRLNI